MKKLRVVSLLVFLLLPFISWSQCTMCACFSVDHNRGCAPLTVTITSCYPGPASGAKYNYDFGNQPLSAPTFSTSHTYNTPGKYVIMQLVNDPPGTNYTTDTVEVLGKPAPLFTTAMCAGNKVKLTITDTNYDLFDVDFGDGSPGALISMAPSANYTYTYASNSPRTISVTGRYTTGFCTGAWTTATQNITPFTTLIAPDLIDLTVLNQSASGTINLRYSGIADRLYKIERKIDGILSPIADTVTATATGINLQALTALNTQGKTYTFRMRNIDMCGSAPAASVEIASIIVTPTALNGSNQVNFVSNGGLVFSPYALYRNTALLNGNVTSPYADNTVTCGTDYCYQVQGTLPTSPTGTIPKSYSASYCIKATYTGTAPVVTNINSTVENNHIKLVWDQPTLNPVVPSVDFYTIYRNDNGSSYYNYGSSNSNSYLDNGASVNSQSYCYKVSYKDACNNVSLISINTCTVYLTVVRTDEVNNLTWNAYTGYTTGIKEYIVENLDESGNVLLSKSVGLATSFSETADPTLAQIIYRIRVVPNGTENLLSVSNTVRIDLTPQVYMPTIFTPNGDGENDVLEVKGKYYKSVKMTIMNKWGEVIFISEDATRGWDGNYKGQPVSVDSYAYHIVAFDNKGQEISLKGVVSLLR